MRLNELRPEEGSKSKKRKRVGRGTGSGTGTTSGRGHDGQNSRAGGGVRPGFEGGQMPLFRRMPKRGFTNNFAKKYVVLNIGDLNRFDNDTVITPELLIKERVINKKKDMDGIKILGNGDLNKKLTVKAHKFSKTATEKIEAAGGKVEVI